MQRRAFVSLELRAILCQVRYMENDRGRECVCISCPPSDGPAHHYGNERHFDGADGCRRSTHILDCGFDRPCSLAVSPFPYGLESDPVPDRQKAGKIFHRHQQRFYGNRLFLLCSRLEMYKSGCRRDTGLYGDLRICMDSLRGCSSPVDPPNTKTGKENDKWNYV